MQLQPEDFLVLATVARYYVLTREQVQMICFDDSGSGRGTRKRLLRLRNAGYLIKHSVPVALPNTNGAAPVYFASKSGAEALASYFDDGRFLATNTRSPRADRLAHWIAINSTRLLVEKAVAKSEDVELLQWYTEWETINKDDPASPRFVLHTQLSETPPLSCSPDAGFLLSSQGFNKVFYLEQDRGTSSPKQVAARKTKGFAELAKRELHRSHFPDTNVPAFSVLVVTTSDYRCQAIGKELTKLPRPDLWLMVNEKQLTPQSLLHGDVTINFQGEAGPLVQPSPTVEVTS